MLGTFLRRHRRLLLLLGVVVYLTKMQIDTNVSESDVGGAKAGERASFTVEAYPGDLFRGEVTQIREAPITVQNVVTYDVVASVDNPKLELLPGMTANVRIIGGRDLPADRPRRLWSGCRRAARARARRRAGERGEERARHFGDLAPAATAELCRRQNRPAAAAGRGARLPGGRVSATDAPRRSATRTPHSCSSRWAAAGGALRGSARTPAPTMHRGGGARLRARYDRGAPLRPRDIDDAGADGRGSGFHVAPIEISRS